jgi:hypothetical protein
MSLAALARSGFAFAERLVLEAPADGFSEPSILGPIGPMEPLGEGELRVDPKRLTFRDLEIRLADIRSATTERADTLQVATRTCMWQFRLRGGSAFRLKNALDRWCHANRAAAAGESPSARSLPGST